MRKLIMMIMVLSSVLYGNVLDRCSYQPIVSYVENIKYEESFGKEHNNDIEVVLEKIKYVKFNNNDKVIICDAVSVFQSISRYDEDMRLVTDSSKGKPAVMFKVDIRYLIYLKHDGSLRIHVMTSKY